MNATARQLWVNQNLEAAIANGTDGVTVDIELPSSTEGTNLLMKELYTSFKAVMPHSQISFDGAIHPASSGWGFDYKTIAEYTDFLIPMGYDMLSPSSHRNSNDPLFGVNGLAKGIGMNIP